MPFRVSRKLTDALVRVGTAYFTENSLQPPSPSQLRSSRPYGWALISLAVVVTVHCSIIHKRKFTRLRYLTHLCSLGVLVSGVSLVVGEPTVPSPHLSLLISTFAASGAQATLVYDLGVRLFGTLLTQIADNLIFYTIFRCTVPDVPQWVIWSLFIAVLLTMYLTWTLQCFLFPFFIDLNSETFSGARLALDILVICFTASFNLGLSAKFVYLLFRDYKGLHQMSNSNKFFALNCSVYSICR